MRTIGNLTDYVVVEEAVLESAEEVQRCESWELPAVVWQVLQPLLPVRNAHRGRPREVDLQRIAAGVFYVLRTGIHWHAVPREQFGPSSTVYYYFRQWTEADVFKQLWANALARYDTVAGIDWEWLSGDGAMRKAPLGGEKNRPQSHGSGEIWDQAQCNCGTSRPPAGDRGSRSELSRSPVTG
jgi:transposase